MTTKTVTLHASAALEYAKLSGTPLTIAANPFDDSERTLDYGDDELDKIYTVNPDLISVKAPIGRIVIGGLNDIGEELIAEGHYWRVWHAEDAEEIGNGWRQEIEIIGLEPILILVDPMSGKTYDGCSERTYCNKTPEVVEAPLDPCHYYKTTSLILINRQLNHDRSSKDYEICAHLLEDGRLYVPGAGVDGGDSLFGSLDKYEPNGTDEFVGHEIGEPGEVDLVDLALADRDNMRNGKTFLTADEAEKAVDLLVEFDEDAARKLAEISNSARADRAQAVLSNPIP